MKKVNLDKKAIIDTAKTVVELAIAVVAVDAFCIVLLSAVQNYQAYGLILAETIKETWSSVLVSLALYNLFLAIGFSIIGKLLVRVGCITFDDKGVRKHVVVISVVITFIFVNLLAFLGGTINNCHEAIYEIAKENLVSNCIAVGCFDVAFVLGITWLIHHWSNGKKEKEDGIEQRR